MNRSESDHRALAEALTRVRHADREALKRYRLLHQRVHQSAVVASAALGLGVVALALLRRPSSRPVAGRLGLIASVLPLGIEWALKLVSRTRAGAVRLPPQGAVAPANHPTRLPVHGTLISNATDQRST